MNGGQLRSVIRHLWETVRPAEAGGLEDAELVRRWAAERDSAAFEVLLWRHGPMVLGLCRRLLRHEQDAEDAFQSTFLTLALKAGSIARGRAVGSWLYTVARRAAQQARAAAARQRPSDPRVLDLLGATADGDAMALDTQEALAEEVGRLPEKYQVAFVLCQLEGLSNEEAARQLGRPVGTVVSRLSRARERLRSRLARRGLAPLAALALLAERAGAAAMPAPLVAETIRAATLAAAAGKVTGAASVPVAALTQGVLRAMWLTKVKTAATVVLAAAILAGAGGAWGYRTRAEGPPVPAADKAAQEVPARPANRLEGAGDRRAEAPDNPKAAAPGERPREVKPPPELVAAVAAALMAEAGKGMNREALLQQVRDEVELLEVQVAVRRAHLEAAKVGVTAPEERVRQMMRQRQVAANSVSDEDLRGAQFVAAQAKAQVAIREAELQEPIVRLKQARRRMSALAHGADARRQREERRRILREKGALPVEGRDARKHKEERLRALEQQLNAIRGEVERLQRELRRDKPGK
jgi:RNA polymerase sigma factor (sigma-70 family)